jgi:hypothetical protein
MSFASLLDHQVYIQRGVGTGTEDDYGQPVGTIETSHIFAAAIQPKSADELALVGQGGAPLGDFNIFMETRLVGTEEVIIHDTDLCPKPDGEDYPDARFEITGIRNETGRGHHLAVDARLIGGPAGVEGS